MNRFALLQLVLLLWQFRAVVIAEQNVSTTEVLSNKPILPPNPTTGGKPNNPGTILRLAKRLLVSNVQQACRDVEKKTPAGRTIHELALTLENGELVINDLRLVTLSLPLTLNNVYPPSQLCWCADQGRVSATGSWTFYPSNSSDQTQYSGSVYVPPSIFVAHVNSTLGRTMENQPAITDIDCQLHLNASKMFFTALTSNGQQFIAEVEPTVTLFVQENLENYLCDVVATVLRLALNTFLTTFRTKITLWEDPDIILDYSLIADPFVDPVDYSINGYLKGAITVNGLSVPFYPNDMATIDNKTNPIITVLFSDFMLNSLLYSAYQSNLMSVIVDAEFSEKMAKYLGLECGVNEICVGSVFQPKMDGSSDSFAELTAVATRPPSAVFFDSGAFMQLSGWLSLDIRTADNRFVKINRMSSPFSLVAELKPLVVMLNRSQPFVAMEAKVTELRLFGSLPAPKYRIVPLLVPILEEIMNKSLRRGIPTPSFDNSNFLRFGDPILSLYNRTLLLRRDL